MTYEWTDKKGLRYIASDRDGGRLAATPPSFEEAPASLPDYRASLLQQRAISGAAVEIIRLSRELEILRATHAEHAESKGKR